MAADDVDETRDLCATLVYDYSIAEETVQKKTTFLTFVYSKGAGRRACRFHVSYRNNEGFFGTFDLSCLLKSLLKTALNDMTQETFSFVMPHMLVYIDTFSKLNAGNVLLIFDTKNITDCQKYGADYLEIVKLCLERNVKIEKESELRTVFSDLKKEFVKPLLKFCKRLPQPCIAASIDDSTMQANFLRSYVTIQMPLVHIKFPENYTDPLNLFDDAYKLDGEWSLITYCNLEQNMPADEKGTAKAPRVQPPRPIPPKSKPRLQKKNVVAGSPTPVSEPKIAPKEKDDGPTDSPIPTCCCKCQCKKN
jgi:hypothetical protein